MMILGQSRAFSFSPNCRIQRRVVSSLAFSAEKSLQNGKPEIKPSKVQRDRIQRKNLQHLSFGFSAGGLLFPYFIGVIKGLTERNVLGGENQIEIAGASAGSLVAACYYSGIDTDEVIERTKIFYHDLRQHGTFGRLHNSLEGTMHDLLPDDVHEKVSNRCYVAITQVEPHLKSKLISKFHSKDDFVNALLCSCYIPGWFDKGQIAKSYRGSLHVDGGVTNFIPIPPPKTEASRAIRVSCFDTSGWPVYNDIDIHPGKFGDTSLPFVPRILAAFNPGDSEFIDQLVAEGRYDAMDWFDTNVIDEE